MALIDKIFGKKKTLSDLNKQELRREEILLTKQRDRLFKRIESISGDSSDTQHFSRSRSFFGSACNR